MELPKLSVIIPTYNYSNYILNAINSILAQNYPVANIEIIVVDDGSTDNTKAVLEPLIASNTIQYFYQQNQGKASATYFAIQKSTGKYIFNLDADDVFLADKMAKFTAVFESDETIVHVGSPAQIIYANKNLNDEVEQIPSAITDKAIPGNELLDYFYNNSMLFGGGSTFAARADVMKKIVIPANVDMYIDEFLIIALLVFGKSYLISTPLSVWNVHNNNYSGQANDKANKIRKDKRLLTSSAGIVEYLKDKNFDKKFLSIYTLIHANREISLKETEGEKTLGDIIGFGKKMVASNVGFATLKKYRMLNRLLPTGVISTLKKLKGSK